MDNYKPVGEEIVEELEILSVLQKHCRIKFMAESGGIPEIKARITGVYSIGEEQYLKTEDGMSIRLDKLISVDDKLLKKNC